MKFEIKSRWTSAVIFTAEIEASDDTPMSIKLGLAVRKAVEVKANLSYANLSSADLRSANLSYADLSYADLRSANLSSANLSYADLSSANLRSADLRSADLRSANLSYADLSYADLRSANLSYANLSSANLSYANLSYADLRYADLSYADLRSANLSSADLRSAALLAGAGNNRHIKTIQAGAYLVAYTDTVMQIGCQRHLISDWWSFDDRKIADMDGKDALKFWRVWKPILQAIIEASPADPTGYVEPKAEEKREEATAE